MSDLKEIIFNTYTRKARLYPILITTLPAGLTALAWFPSGVNGWGNVWALMVWAGIMLLFTQVGRDLGKKKEPILFKLWGGKPTTRLLRHRDAPNKITLNRIHRKLEVLIKDIKMPTEEEEKLDPQAADEVYDSCVTVLREKTRDKKKFNLLFDENCSYGFRRNLWGLKPFGISIAVIGMVAVIILIVLNYTFLKVETPFISIAIGLINFLLLLGWVFWFIPDWVRLAADAYAERLLATCEEL